MPEPDEVGLCRTCRHSRIVPAPRSTFYLCERSFIDPRFLKYPPLPVIRCVGFEPLPPAVNEPETEE
jgi:hypothetical protein